MTYKTDWTSERKKYQSAISASGTVSALDSKLNREEEDSSVGSQAVLDEEEAQTQFGKHGSEIAVTKYLVPVTNPDLEEQASVAATEKTRPIRKLIYALKGLVLLEPYLEPEYPYVVKKTDPNLKNVDVGDRLKAVEDMDGYWVFSGYPLESIRSGTSLTFGEFGDSGKAPRKGELFIFLEKFKSSHLRKAKQERNMKRAVFRMLETIIESNVIMNTNITNFDIDDVLYNMLIGKEYRLLRRIAKISSSSGNGFLKHGTLLEYLLNQQKAGTNPYPKLTSLLSDPDLYRKKKVGHKMKYLVERGSEVKWLTK